MGNGLIGKIFAWGQSPLYSDTTVNEWLAGLGVVIILAFLWTTVLRQILRETAATV